MAQLPESIVDPVASAIFAHYKAKHDAEPARGYLGASSIGKSCSRALWYGFRWAQPAEFTGRLYRLFQSGHLQEPRVVADLRAIGCQVYEVNPADGKQFSFSEPATGHHFRGNCDGILTGLPGAEKTVHMLEVKTSSDKLFKVLQKDGVEKAKPEHFAQMQIYMKWSIDKFGDDGCKRALYVCVNKNTDDIHTERLEYRPAAAQALIDKALAIVKAVEPPIGISTDSTYYECKFCDYHALCHGTAVPAPTCRSCAWVTPLTKEKEPVWACNNHVGFWVDDAKQRQGCAKHLFIPVLLVRTASTVDATDTSVTYRTDLGNQFTNGDPAQHPEHLSSAEIHAAQDKAILGSVANDAFLMEMRTKFDGRLVA